MASRLALSMAAAARQTLEREAVELEALRATLTPEEQSLLTLRVDRELSWREVAEVMAEEGRPADEPALRKRFGRLKEKLAGAARERGLLPDPRNS
jgi:DNA-directed RNA polymerase specialized sigma24 family protein